VEFQHKGESIDSRDGNELIRVEHRDFVLPRIPGLADRVAHRL
jgi:hypothetical protein